MDFLALLFNISSIILENLRKSFSYPFELKFRSVCVWVCMRVCVWVGRGSSIFLKSSLECFSKFSWEQLNETVLLPSRRLQEGIKEARREANKYKDLSTAAASKRQKRRPKKSAAKLQTAILPSQEPGKSSEPPKKKKQKSLKTTEEAGENGVAKNESARGFNNDVLSSIFTSWVLNWGCCSTFENGSAEIGIWRTKRITWD